MWTKIDADMDAPDEMSSRISDADEMPLEETKRSSDADDDAAPTEVASEETNEAAKRISIVSLLTLNILDAPPAACPRPCCDTCICCDNIEKLFNSADFLKFAISFFAIAIRRDDLYRNLQRNELSEIVVRYIIMAWESMMLERFNPDDSLAELDQAAHHFYENYYSLDTMRNLSAMRAQMRMLRDPAPNVDEVIYWTFNRTH